MTLFAKLFVLKKHFQLADRLGWSLYDDWSVRFLASLSELRPAASEPYTTATQRPLASEEGSQLRSIQRRFGEHKIKCLDLRSMQL